MRSVKFLIAAGAASLLSSAAFAADMPIMPPPDYAPPPIADFGGWYLRGDIGFSNQSMIDRLNNVLDVNSLTSRPAAWLRHRWYLRSRRLAIRFNNWFRADVTGAISRPNTNFHGLARASRST